MELLHPGIYAFEEATIPTIEGVGVSAGALLGIAEKGPIDKPGFVTNFSQYKEMYGSYWQNNYLTYEVEAFFRQGGTRLYVGRVVGSGAVASSVHFPDCEIGVFPTGDEDTHSSISVSANSPGTYGDNLNVNSVRYETYTTDVVLDEAEEIPVADVSGFKVHDVILLRSATVRVTAIITGIDYLNSKVLVRPLDIRDVTTGLAVNYPGTGYFEANTSVKTSSSHKVTGYITENLVGVSGTTYSVKVSNTLDLTIGSMIMLGDSANLLEGRITGISGSTITFELLNTDLEAAIVPGTVIISSGSPFSSMEFLFGVYLNGALVDGAHTNLTLEELNLLDHIDLRLKGDDNQSSYIKAEDLKNASARNIAKPFNVYRFPAPIALFMKDGEDGAAPTSADYKGTAAPSGEKRGLGLFDVVSENLTIAIPGNTSVDVIRYGIQYCANRADSIFVAEVPLASNTPLKAKEFRQVTLNVESSYGALYYPWLKISNPSIANTTLTLPPSGFVVGIYSEVAARRGVHKAPANEVILDISGLTYPVDNGVMDLLNPIGVNCITSQFQGQGVKVYGARTLQSKADGYHFVPVRRLVNYIKKSILDAVPDAPFEPNDKTLWRSLETRISGFLRGLWSDKMLYPEEDVTQAFFVNINAETNPQVYINQGQLRGRIGINPPKPAEKIVFFFTLLPTGGVEFQGA